MGLPKGEKSMFTNQVRTGDAVQIKLDRVRGRAALADGMLKAGRPPTDKLSAQDDPDFVM